ncbi:MAG: sulfite exporter TauE/SafE family protein [Cellvibrionales bacterium]|nr:sulfite exporter TauE/SafE family protein [Cellvibrionales bacterium]
MSLFIGLLIGLVLGLTGAGGSVFAVPLLLLLDVPLHQAIGLSLGAVAISAIIGTLNKLRSNDIQWLPAMIFLIIGAVAAPFGNHLNQFIHETTLLTSFVILVLVIATKLWLQANKTPAHAQSVRAAKNSPESNVTPNCRYATQDMANRSSINISPKCLISLGAGAMVTGTLSGLFGVGGGFIIVPVLLYLTGISIQKAVATSLAIIAAISLSGFTSFIATNPLPNLQILAYLSIGGSIGMLAGTHISHSIAGPKLQKTFALLMIIIALVTLIREL